jgi:hypothetical protein
MKDNIFLILVVLFYVAWMNWLGGEKFLIGNRIREAIKKLRYKGGYVV